MSNALKSILRSDDLISETKKMIKEVYLLNEIPWVIGYSGGKDSTTTTQIIIETLLDMREDGVELHKPVYIITSDTLVENPMIINIIEENINGINRLAKESELPILASIVKPNYSKSFWTNLIGRGYPSPNQTFRWCTDRLKIEPANSFINEIVDSHGEAIMILGVRDGESNSRDRVLTNHTIDGKKLMRHTTMPNAYVFAPIRNFTLEDIWNYLLQHNSPWGCDNRELYKLYSESSGSSECPLIIDEYTKNHSGSCGNSRFGCWVCTVVKEDKSLTGFIENGVDWLRPLLKYRNWLYEIRDNNEMRMKRRTNGTIYYSKIDFIDEDTLLIEAKGAREKNYIRRTTNGWIDSNNVEWTVIESYKSEELANSYIKENKIDLSSGMNPRIIIKNVNDEYLQLGNGPFTLKTRMEMLENLLIIQRDLEQKYQLIRNEELYEIKRIWDRQGDWNDSTNKIYTKVYGFRYQNVYDDIKLFDSQNISWLVELCEENRYDFATYNELLHIAKDYSGYINRSDAIKEIQKVLNKEYLLVEGSVINDN